MTHLSINCLLRVWVNAFGHWGSSDQINVNVTAPNAWHRACDCVHMKTAEEKSTLLVMKNAMQKLPTCPECAVLLDQAIENQRKL